MGVLACDRNSCENIMCERYSSIHGYICNECFEELVMLGPSTDVGYFMECPPKRNTLKANQAYFDAIFEQR